MDSRSQLRNRRSLIVRIGQWLFTPSARWTVLVRTTLLLLVRCQCLRPLVSLGHLALLRLLVNVDIRLPAPHRLLVRVRWWALRQPLVIFRLLVRLLARHPLVFLRPLVRLRLLVFLRLLVRPRLLLFLRLLVQLRLLAFSPELWLGAPHRCLDRHLEIVLRPMVIPAGS